MSDLIGKEYRAFDGIRTWELLIDDTLLVIVDTGVKVGRDTNLLGIDTRDLRVKWAVGGNLRSNDGYDGIVNVYLKSGQVWAGAWSGTHYRIDPQSGEVLEEIFLK